MPWGDLKMNRLQIAEKQMYSALAFVLWYLFIGHEHSHSLFNGGLSHGHSHRGHGHSHKHGHTHDHGHSHGLPHGQEYCHGKYLLS